MGSGWISIVKSAKGVSKVKVPKLRFAGLSSSLSSLGSRFSAWIQGTKFSSWLKAGLAGGIGYTIYHGWKSGIDTIADATGLDSGTVESLLFAFFGVVVAYVAAKLLFPDSGSGKTTVVVNGSKSSGSFKSFKSSKSRFGSSGVRSRGSSVKKKSVVKNAVSSAKSSSKSKGGRR